MNDQEAAATLRVETAPFPQQIVKPCCDEEATRLILDERTSGTSCRTCQQMIEYIHNRQEAEAQGDDTEQVELLTDGGTPNAATYRPFMVADRPNHLEVLADAAEVSDHFGVLSRANVTGTVEDLIAEIDVPVIIDNGAFAEAETDEDLIELFDAFDRMAADFGLLPDVIGSRQETNDLFAQAMRLRERGRRSWEWTPVGVAQGDTPTEYADSLWDIYQMGADHIAIGGLLETVGCRSGGHATGQAELLDILADIRGREPRIWEETWTFALGCHHPNRRPRFEDLGVAAADSKRWLFQYDDGDARDEQLAQAVVADATDRSPSLQTFARGQADG